MVIIPALKDNGIKRSPCVPFYIVIPVIGNLL